MSQSTSRTRRPARARLVARWQDRVDLPSPPVALAIMTVLVPLSWAFLSSSVRAASIDSVRTLCQ